MTLNEFQEQLQRLRIRFGERAFDQEFVKLAWAEVRDLDGEEFEHVVNVMIGTRSPSRPPLLTDFKESRIGVEKNRFQKATVEAHRKLHEPISTDGLKKVLAKHWPGCTSVAEAIEVERLKIQVQRANESAEEQF